VIRPGQRANSALDRFLIKRLPISSTRQIWALSLIDRCWVLCQQESKSPVARLLQLLNIFQNLKSRKKTVTTFGVLRWCTRWLKAADTSSAMNYQHLVNHLRRRNSNLLSRPPCQPPVQRPEAKLQTDSHSSAELYAGSWSMRASKCAFGMLETSPCSPSQLSTR
jgi:hypothetical protein